MVSEESIKNHVKKLSKLVQYKNKSEAELYEIAKKKAELEDPDLQIDFVDNTEEKKLAKQLLTKYIEDYSIETISDKTSLKQIIYQEIIQHRMQQQLNDVHKQGRPVPGNAVETLQKNLDSILKAKTSLGLTKKDKDKEEDSAAKAFQLLKQKAKKWREENQGSRTLVCPHCSKMVLLKIRTDAWEALRHPFFKDRILTNDHLIKLYLKNKITKIDLATIFGTSEDYIDWILKRIYNNKNMETSQNDKEDGVEKVEEISKKIKTS